MAVRRGRTSGFAMGDEHRTKIANSQILKRLIQHALGVTEMTATQVQAAIALMKKILPDLQAIEVQADVIQHVISERPLTPDEWAAEHSADDGEQPSATH